MKTLKKALAVVLALAMVLGMTVVASADFVDAEKITPKYKEACEVMNELEVFIGDASKKMDPQGQLTRAQAAKLIAYLDLGKKAAEALAPVQVFSDVPATHWAAKYIGYLKDAEYVAGVGNNKFDPEGALSGYAFAKMLLGVLGYDAETEKMLGTAWELATSKLMSATGIGKGTNFLGKEQLKREEAAQFCFEALKATMVEYPFTGTTIEVGGAVVKTGAAAADPVKNTGSTDGNLTGNKDGYMQLGEKLFAKLKVGEKEADVFGRPAHEWMNGSESIGVYADEADLVYTAAVKNKAIYKDLGLATPTTFSVVVDGDPADALKVEKGNDTTFNKSGNGVLTEVFYDKDAELKTIVVINTYVGKVDKVVKATDAADRKIVISGKSANKSGSYDFETEAFAAKDIVAFTYADKEVQTVALLEAHEAGKITKATKANTTLKLKNIEADATYKPNQNAAEETPGLVAVNNKVNVYLDQYGYYLYATEIESVTNYAVIIGEGTTGSVYGESSKVGATLLFEDGTTKEVTAKWDDTKPETYVGGKLEVKDAEAYVVKYTIDDDGVYKLTLAGTTSKDPEKAIVVGGKSATVVDTDTTKYATDKTIYFVATKETDKYSYKVYTGYKNVPSVAAEKAEVVNYVLGDEASTKDQLQVVYLAVTETVDANAKATYILKDAKADLVTVSTGSSSYTYYALDAVVDGELVTLNVSETVYKNKLTTTITAVKGVSTDKNGVVTALGSKIDMDDAEGTVAEKNGVVGVGDEFFAYADDLDVVTVNEDLDEMTVGTVDSVETDENDLVFFKVETSSNNKKYITDMYIIQVKNTAK